MRLFQFIVEESLEGYLEDTHKIVIGVVPENFEVTVGHCVGDGHSFGYAAQKGHKVGGGGSEPVFYGLPYANGDRVGVLANPLTNEISFYLNGQCQGVAFSGLMDTDTRSYQFAVSLVRSHMRVRIVTSSKLPSTGQNAPASTNASTYEQYTQNKQLARLQASLSSLKLYHDFAISDLPMEVLQRIFGYLPFHELLDCALVQRHWARVATSDYLWRAVAQTMTPYPELLIQASNQSYHQAVHH